MRELVRLWECPKCKKDNETRDDADEMDTESVPQCKKCKVDFKMTGKFVVRKTGKHKTKKLTGLPRHEAEALKEKLDKRARDYDSSPKGRAIRQERFEQLRAQGVPVGPMPGMFKK